MLWSWLLTISGVTGLWLAGSGGSRARKGWALGVFNQTLWLTYAITTEQYGFILGAVAYGFVHGRNLWRIYHDPR